jgi:hypothetical protein
LKIARDTRVLERLALTGGPGAQAADQGFRGGR